MRRVSLVIIAAVVAALAAYQVAWERYAHAWLAGEYRILHHWYDDPLNAALAVGAIVLIVGWMLASAGNREEKR